MKIFKTIYKQKEWFKWLKQTHSPLRETNIWSRNDKEEVVAINAIILMDYFPNVWKITQPIIIVDVDKNRASIFIQTYKISPNTVQTLWENICKETTISNLRKGIITGHQFGLKHKYGTIEQVHIIDKMNKDIKTIIFCSAAFININQPFDNVYYTGLYYRVKKYLHYSYYNVLK